MPPIGVLIKPASGMCNMKCDYCFYCDEAKKRTFKSYGFMSEQTLKNVIRKTILRAENSISYTFQGGEPTLRGIDFFRKAVKYQRQYNKNNISVYNSLQTNGYQLDEEWCSFFKENNFLLGLSVDGIKQTHDAYRHNSLGNGTFEKVLQAAKLMDKYEVDYNILTVVNQKVAGQIEEIYKFYKENSWNYQQYIACLDPLEEIKGENIYSLTPDLYGEFLVKLFELWYKDWKEGKEPYIRQFENYIGILLGYQPEACEQRGICGIQNVIEADGSVYPCDFYALDEYYLGNFNENNLDDIDKKRKEMNFIECSLKLKNECKACSYFGICRGGCMRNRDRDEADGLYINYFCKSYKIFFGKCLERLIEVAKKR